RRALASVSRLPACLRRVGRSPIGYVRAPASARCEGTGRTHRLRGRSYSAPPSHQPPLGFRYSRSISTAHHSPDQRTSDQPDRDEQDKVPGVLPSVEVAFDASTSSPTRSPGPPVRALTAGSLPHAPSAIRNTPQQTGT